MTMMKLKEMNLEDRPRERLVSKGPGALGNAELMAILLRTGGGGLNVLETAQALLASAGSLSGLSAMSLEKMKEIRGIGVDKAVTISAAFELGRRFAGEKAESPAQVTSAKQIHGIMQPIMKVSVSAMTHPWHKESRVLCPAILFPIYRGEDSCMLQVSDVVGRRLC